jgi:hypothetical protein
METNATETQGKETATEYNTVIPLAHALYTSPLLTTPNRPLTFPLAPPPTCLNPVRYKYPTHQPLPYFIDLPLKMEPIECSETSAISTQTPRKHPKENMLHLTHGKSLESRYPILFAYVSYSSVLHSTVSNSSLPITYSWILKFSFHKLFWRLYLWCILHTWDLVLCIFKLYYCCFRQILLRWSLASTSTIFFKVLNEQLHTINENDSSTCHNVSIHLCSSDGEARRSCWISRNNSMPYWIFWKKSFFCTRSFE